jgi:poly-gamma-glutamate synthesis protein (capsule biosynthesis protein)
MTGRGIDQVLPQSVDPRLHERYVRDARDYVSLAERRHGVIPRPVGFDYVWGDALGVWDRLAPDLRIVNLETSITLSDEFWLSKAIHYRMHPANVACLTEANLDCCVLANNHVLDWGYAGLAETLATLSAAGIATAGAGSDADEAARPARLSVPAKGDVLVFSLAAESSGVPPDWAAVGGRAGVHLLDDLSEASACEFGEHVSRHRQPGDVVVVSIHWGSNWGYEVPEEQRRFAHHLIDACAADLVHGHSSHHARGIEIYQGKLILYGTGDFVTDYEGIGSHEDFRPWLSPMYFATVDPDTGELGRLEIVLMKLERFRLVAADAGDRRWLLRRLQELSEVFGTPVRADGRSLIVEGEAGLGDCTTHGAEEATGP